MILLFELCQAPHVNKEKLDISDYISSNSICFLYTTKICERKTRYFPMLASYPDKIFVTETYPFLLPPHRLLLEVNFKHCIISPIVNSVYTSKIFFHNAKYLLSIDNTYINNQQKLNNATISKQCV